VRLRKKLLVRNNVGLSEVISTVIMTSVMIVIIVTASFFANDVLSSNVEGVHFDQSVNAVLCLERMTKNMMFKPLSTGTVTTSFVTTDPYVAEEGTMTIHITNGTGLFTVASILEYKFKVEGGDRVGVSSNFYYVGNDGSSSLLLTGLNGSLSCVKKYQDNGAWVSLDCSRIRCIYGGVMSYYDSSNPVPVKRNVIEITVVRLSSGDISPLETSRIILENMGIQTQQIFQSGNFNIKVQLGNKESPTKSLIDLGGNATLSTVINLSIIDFRITVLGGG